MKRQTELDRRRGALSRVEIESGCRTDNATSLQPVQRVDALRITVLGDFTVPVFAAMIAASEPFLSRLPYGPGVC